MANTRAYPVLTAILSQRGYTMDRKPSVIKVSDLARVSGLPAKDIKKILADNDGCLVKNDKGSLVGVNIVSAACVQGLVLQYRDGVQGSSFMRQFFVKGKRIGATFNLDIPDDRKKAEAEAAALEKEHGVPVCRTLGDLSDAILEKVWKEPRS